MISKLIPMMHKEKYNYLYSSVWGNFKMIAIAIELILMHKNNYSLLSEIESILFNKIGDN